MTLSPADAERALLFLTSEGVRWKRSRWQWLEWAGLDPVACSERLARRFAPQAEAHRRTLELRRNGLVVPAEAA